MSDWISIIVFPLIAVKEKKIKRVAALLCKGLQGCYPALWQVCHEAVHLKNLICTQVHKQPASNRSCPGSPRSPPESPLLLNGFCLAVHELDIIMKSKRKRCFSLSLHLSFSLLAGFLHSWTKKTLIKQRHYDLFKGIFRNNCCCLSCNHPGMLACLCICASAYTVASLVFVCVHLKYI